MCGMCCFPVGTRRQKGEYVLCVSSLGNVYLDFFTQTDFFCASAMGGIAFMAVAQYALPFVLAEVEREFGKEAKERIQRRLLIQRIFVLAITLTTTYSSLSLQWKLGLPVVVRVLNWVLFGTSCVQLGRAF